MMTESMPVRCSSRVSISPAGPAPIMPTCVRMNEPPAIAPHASYTGSLSRRQRDEARKGWHKYVGSERPAVARHRINIMLVGVAEPSRQIALLALDHAEVDHQHKNNRHHQHPVRRQHDGESRQNQGPAEIHRIPQPADYAGF